MRKGVIMEENGYTKAPQEGYYVPEEPNPGMAVAGMICGILSIRVMLLLAVYHIDSGRCRIGITVMYWQSKRLVPGWQLPGSYARSLDCLFRFV